MKKIICLIDSLGHGGAQRQLTGLALMLKESGYEIKVLYYHAIEFYLEELRMAGIDTKLCRSNGSLLKRIRLIRREISDFKPDVVIAYLDTPSMISCLVKALNYRFKLIVSERNITRKENLRTKLKFWLYKCADYVVANSYSQSDYIRNTRKKLRPKTLTITNFTEIKELVPRPPLTDCPTIVVAASLIPSKNTLRFIEALSILKSEGYKFRVDWFGETPNEKEYADSCRAKISELGLEEYIMIHPRTHDILYKYQKANYFCLPSLYEGTPNALCEAIACGMPVACSDVSDNSKYVVDGENGFLMNPESSVSISEAIKKLLDLNEEDYYRFAEKNRQVAVVKFSKERFINQYIALIDA